MWYKTNEQLPDSLPDGIRVIVVGPAFNDYTKGFFTSGSIFWNGNFYTEDGDDMFWPCMWTNVPEGIPKDNEK